MPALDSQGRELIISCGAALGHLCLAIHGVGHAPLVQLFPDSKQPDLLARVRLASHRPPTDDDKLLFGFITERHTQRGQFEDRALSPELLQTLQSEAEQERGDLIDLIERGDLIQNSNPFARRDVADWIAPHGERDDGIPASALGMGDLLSHIAPFAMRAFDRGEAIAAKDVKLADNAPVLAVLCTPQDGTESWLDAGQALSRVLLRARASGVWASFFNQPVEVDEVWVGLRRIVGASRFPQLIFRLGYAQPVPATPRRPLGEVTNIHDSPFDSNEIDHLAGKI